MQPLLHSIAGLFSAVAREGGPFLKLLSGQGAVGTGLIAVLDAVASGLDSVGQIIVALGPGVRSLAGGIATVVTEALPSIVRLVQTVVPVISSLVDSVGPALGGLVATLAPVLGQLLAAAGPALTQVLLALAPAIGAIAEATAPAADILGTVGDLLAGLIPILADLFVAVAPVATELLRLAGAFLKGLLPALEPLMPVIQQLSNDLVPVLASLAPAFEALGKSLGGALVTAAPVLAALALAAVQLVAALLRIIPPGALVGTIFAALGVQLGVALVGAVQSAVVALGALLSPVVLVVAGVAALAAGVVYAYTHFQGFRDAVDGVAKFLTTTVGPAIAAFASGVADQFSHLVEWVRQNWADISEAIGHVMTVVGDIIGVQVAAITLVWRTFGDEILNIARIVWDQIRNVVETAVRLVRDVIQIGIALINGDWGKAWDGLKDIVDAAWDFIRTSVTNALKLLKETVEVGFSAVRLAWDAVWDGLKGVVQTVLAQMVDIFLGGVSLILDGAERMFGWVPGVGGKLREAKDRFDEFRDGVNDALGGIADKTVQLDLSTRALTHEEAAARFAGEHFAWGGRVPGTGSGDTVPAWLTAGEYVFSKPAVDRIGAANLESVHQRARRGYADGGLVSLGVSLPSIAGISDSARDLLNTLAIEAIQQASRDLAAQVARATSSDASGEIRDWIDRAMQITGVGEDWREPLYRRAIWESGGRNIPQGITDVNTEQGTPAFGPMQVIEPTFNAYKVPGHEDWHNPVDSIAAAIRYIQARYGSIHEIDPPTQGYGIGGLVKAIVHAASFDRGGVLREGLNLVHNGTGAPERLVPAGPAIDYDRLARAMAREMATAVSGHGHDIVTDGRRTARAMAKHNAEALANHKVGRS
jgi:SLT domain-containing protein/phage-related protein